MTHEMGFPTESDLPRFLPEAGQPGLPVELPGHHLPIPSSDKRLIALGGDVGRVVGLDGSVLMAANYDSIGGEIKQKAAEIRAREQAAQQAAERVTAEQAVARQQAHEKARHESEVKTALGKQFAYWALGNDIPYDFHGHDERTKFEKFRNTPPQLRAYGMNVLPKGWIVGTKHVARSNGSDHGEDIHIPYHLLVDSSGSYFLDSRRLLSTYGGYSDVLTHPIKHFSLEQIQDGIAKQVAKHKKPW